jgi:hypothetical protein
MDPDGKCQPFKPFDSLTLWEESIQAIAFIARPPEQTLN